MTLQALVTVAALTPGWNLTLTLAPSCDIYDVAYMSLEGSSEFANFTIYLFCVKDPEEGQAVAVSKSPFR